jgi:excinuclease ABC subunit C
LYIGEARSLKPRVRSFLQESANHELRIAALVAEARDLDFNVTRSEVEALILENNLIKEHHPPLQRDAPRRQQLPVPEAHDQ